MTKYHGGKQRIGAEIARIIKNVSEQVEEYTGIRFKGYLEPFCGMLGVYQHIPELFQDHRSFAYKAGDINESVIKMWKEAQKGWKPPTKCSEKRFYQLKGNGKSSAEKGFVGHACAFRGIYFITYDDSISNDQLKIGSKRVISISQNILRKFNVEMKQSIYSDWKNIKRNIIYCDPPYFSGSKFIDEFNHHREFDYSKFYKWAEKLAENNLVFISERAKLPYTMVGKFMNDEKLYLINKF